MPASKQARTLSDAQIAQFIQDGFVRIDGAFPRELAEQGRSILWRDLSCDPDDATTWTQPVIRLGYYSDELVESGMKPRAVDGFPEGLFAVIAEADHRPRPCRGVVGIAR